ncbi:hypothetical protein [Jannaschia aquimarina]|uniref:Uncharacterized protein n=1 Tax=Jannaschia aquimarina TaxID=935700 RepID=A0A0D1D4S6_9RHOB|nr:hypothetical protein [Jannaschia aquimarina]KIT15073.1 hypothetical protein jaqu_33990 [Jannaschia aquimarina]SNS63346.1 hypothetical protein SAMN05421775_101725 [Jannaschia aquimarina]
MVQGEDAAPDALKCPLVTSGTRRSIRFKRPSAFNILRGWLQPHHPMKNPGLIRDLARQRALEISSLHPENVECGKALPDPPVTSLSTITTRVRVGMAKLRGRFLLRGTLTDEDTAGP